MSSLEERIEDWISSYSSYLYRFAYVLYPQDACELVQRTWIQAWKHQEQLRDEVVIKSWLRTICYREFLMMVRSNKESESIEELELQGIEFADEEEDIIEELIVEDMIQTIRNGCFVGMASKLTLMQRSAFSLVDMFGLSLKDTALLMNISVAAVKGLLVRARNNLSSFFGTHCQFIHVTNPCRCMAWKDFIQQRELHQHKVKTAFTALEYEQKKVKDQDDVRKKLLSYYHHIPIQIPDKDWYTEIIKILKIES